MANKGKQSNRRESIPVAYMSQNEEYATLRNLLLIIIIAQFALTFCSCSNEEDPKVKRSLLDNPFGVDRPYGRMSNIEVIPERQKISKAISADRNLIAFQYISAARNEDATYNFVLIKENGQAEYIFVRSTNPEGRQIWSKRSFSIPANEIQSLKNAILKVDFFSLPRGYHLRNAYDGFGRYIAVRANGVEKSISLDNCIPEAILPLLKQETIVFGDLSKSVGETTQVDAQKYFDATGYPSFDIR